MILSENLIPITISIVVGIVFIYKYLTLLDKFKKNEFIQYVDTSGIQVNPPKFIETWQGKTINFKLNEYVVSICQLPIIYTFKKYETITSIWTEMVNLLKTEKNMMNSIRYMALYNQLISSIYDLSKHFVNKRFGYKKVLFKKGSTDMLFILGVCEEIFDYWSYIKKKILLLARGTTNNQTPGEISTIDLSKMGELTQRFVKPRFESILKGQQN